MIITCRRAFSAAHITPRPLLHPYAIVVAILEAIYCIAVVTPIDVHTKDAARRRNFRELRAGPALIQNVDLLKLLLLLYKFDCVAESRAYAESTKQ